MRVSSKKVELGPDRYLVRRSLHLYFSLVASSGGTRQYLRMLHGFPMRYVCLFMTLVFALFTYWQLNDLKQYETEKWYLWVLAYGLCAVISLICFFKRLPVIVFIAMAVGAVSVAVWRVQGIEWDSTILYNSKNPSGNETGGLLFICLWMIVLAWGRRTSARKHTDL